MTPPTPPRILVAGIGNIFLGDDAFGCEVAQRLAHRPHPPCVRIIDFGIRSLDLTYALLDNYNAVILIDAAPRGEPPGTLYIIEPQLNDSLNAELDTHGMDPVKVLEAAISLGAHINKILLVACEPTPQNTDTDCELPLSAPVKSAVEEAIPMIESLIKDILNVSCRAGSDLTGGAHHESLIAGSRTNRPSGDPLV